MGTRALIKIKDKDDVVFCTIYKHSDGYPSSTAILIKDIIRDKSLANGICSRSTGRHFNGMECLAASLVAGLKKSIGEIYLYSADTIDIGEDYIYIIYQIENEIYLKIQRPGYSKLLYDNKAKNFDITEIANYDEDD